MDNVYLYERLVRLHAEILREQQVSHPLFPRRILRSYLKTLLFQGGENEIQDAIKHYGFILGENGCRRWSLFIRMAYAMNLQNLESELKSFTRMSLHDRVREVTRILREKGIADSSRWFFIIVLYAVRGFRDEREDACCLKCHRRDGQAKQMGRA